MNRELKQKIEEAAEKYDDAQSLANPFADDLYKAFKAGAQFLLDDGVRYTKEDMIDFVEYCHINAYKPEEVFGLWLKERENNER